MAQTASSSSTTSTSTPTSPTILTHLHSLLALQTIPSLPYLHPYAPSKGKAKADDLSISGQLELLGQLKRGVLDAKSALERASGKDEKVKLARAMKEVATHQSSLLSLTHSIPSEPTRPTTLPSPQIHLPPVDLLKHLASSLSIQAYIEDSQFGLLKTSLALAGVCFVVDVDLETDAVAGNDEDDEMDVDSAIVAEGTGVEREGKGKVRLSKITANHVRGEATGKSDWIARVLREKLEVYLGVWNEGGERDWDGQLRLEKAIRRVEKELRDLKELDQAAERAGKDNGADWFTDLENLVTTLDDKWRDQSTSYFSGHCNIFPTFKLLPSTTQPNPTFHFRPSRSGESIPVPVTTIESIGETTFPWLGGSWILEYTGDQAHPVNDGLVVRQSWMTDDGDEGETSWEGVVRVEHLLYRRSAMGSSSGTALQFPYTADFVHKGKSGSMNESGWEQRWAIAEPGPEGFLVGRIGVPSSFEGLEIVFQMLRCQLVLNRLFHRVFTQQHLDDTDDEDDGDDIDDLLSAPRAIPITTTLRQRSICITMPLPHQDTDIAPTLSLTLTPSSDPITDFVDLAWDCPVVDDATRGRIEDAVEMQRGQKGDLVEIVHCIEKHLK